MKLSNLKSRIPIHFHKCSFTCSVQHKRRYNNSVNLNISSDSLSVQLDFKFLISMSRLFIIKIT